jgi:hypothetical protein
LTVLLRGLVVAPNKRKYKVLLEGLYFEVRIKHLREWLFHSRLGVGVRVKNSLGVGVGTGVGANNLLGVDSGVDFYCLNFALVLASNTLVYMVIYRTGVYTICIYEKQVTIFTIFFIKLFTT